MKRNTLILPDEYTAALSERLQFDLGSANLATRAGKAFIAQMAENVSRIREGLTTKREEFLASAYLRQKEIREAYVLYYMTTNILKVTQPLYELSLSGFFEQPGPLRILDLGTGTGAAIWGTLGFLNEGSHNISTEIILTDSLRENLNEAEHFSRYFIKKLSANAQLAFEIFDLRSPENIPEKIRDSGQYHLLTMMNVLNELDESNDRILIRTLSSLLEDNGSLVMIEPATRAESRRLLRFRDLAVSMGLTVYSPCTRQAECPALINANDWCHSDTPWERPAFIKAIDEVVGTLRLSLKSTYLVLRKDNLTLSESLAKPNLHRVVSERFDEKGRVRAILCGENGRYEHTINKRDINDLNRDFSAIERYDLVSTIGEEPREHDIKLLKETNFTIVLPILGAR